ncbi:MAG: GNAT family N-acetyltransferase [Clostridiaceae bacterium]|nr:GNAT family N-acetyltransferase [Clostridiaceae bacterium]
MMNLKYIKAKKDDADILIKIYNGEYYLGCLCVIPEYQGKGIGTHAVKFILNYYADWEKIMLVTPADKEENLIFYKKCGFTIDGAEMDGKVSVVRFLLER